MSYTRYGYPLIGECLDEIKKQTDVIEDIWTVRNGNDISVQVLVKLDGVHLNISVPLTEKISKLMRHQRMGKTPKPTKQFKFKG